MEHLNMTTSDGAQLNLDALYKICPSCFTEAVDKDGNVKRVVDFKKLRALLGDDAEDDAPEAYDFTWVGKRAAQREAAAPIKKTLRPCPEESVDWENTQNLYIEGDNLEVLKLLQNSYMGKVKMIYIDPPYNTGNDFVYHDDFAQSADEYNEHNINEDGERFRKNTDSNGRFHSDWCSMMYARLMVARTLLREDGVIFISIDDNEVRNLRNICDEVFGEKNFIAQLIWKSKSGGANDSKYIAVDHEYIICCAKNADVLSKFMDNKAEVSTSYNLRDEKGEYSLDRLDKQSIRYSESLDYEIVGPDGKSYYPQHKDPSHPNASWRWSKDHVKNNYDELVFKNGCVYTKNYKKDENIARSLLMEDRFGRTRTGKTDFTELFDVAYFSAPKPVKLVYHLANISTKADDIILDFFSGSGTTFQSVAQLNSEDNNNRKVILVQLQEKLEESTEAYKAGFRIIPDISKERLRRAGKKIKSESSNVDTGFRVFKCDTSNMKDVYFAPKEYNQQMLFDLEDNIKEDRTDLDLLFDCMLRWGVELSLPLSSEKVGSCTIHNVNDGDLVACFDGKITDEVIDAIADLSPLRVVFRDSSFTEASQKMNLFELFKQKCGWSDEEVKNNVKVI